MRTASVPEAAAVVRRAEEEVDARVPELLVGLLLVLDHPGHLAVDEDREDGDAFVLAARLLAARARGVSPRHQRCDLGIGAELDDPIDVRLRRAAAGRRDLHAVP